MVVEHGGPSVAPRIATALEPPPALLPAAAFIAAICGCIVACLYCCGVFKKKESSAHEQWEGEEEWEEEEG